MRVYSGAVRGWVAIGLAVAVSCDDSKEKEGLKEGRSPGGGHRTSAEEKRPALPAPGKGKSKLAKPEAGSVAESVAAALESDDPETRLASFGGVLVRAADPETKIRIYEALPSASREAGLVVSDFIASGYGPADLGRFYSLMPFGKDRQRIASELVRKEFQIDSDCSRAMSAMDRLEYSEEFDAAVIGMLSNDNFRSALSDGDRKSLRTMIEQRDGPRKLAALQLLK